jgi:pimeloyl-ACP methyl ester carboxylesterase
MLHTVSILVLTFFSHLAAPAGRTDGQPEAFPGIETPVPAPRPGKHQAVKDPTPLPGSSFVRYFTTDEFDRSIVFYVRVPEAKQGDETKLPIILYVQGSGSQSVFTRVEQDGVERAAASGGQGVITKAANDRAIVIIAEKPGVRFMECPKQPGGAVDASREFREEHTLPRWSAAVSAALHASLTLPRADPSSVLLVGHSEGGLLACKVAADNPVVTHVATLAGGGPTQLYDLIELARRGTFCGGGNPDPQACVNLLLEQWENVLRAPDSAENDFLGHPHRRWTSFLATSPLEELKKTRAKVFIGQGLDDQAVLPASADVLFATLKAVGRDPVYSRVPGDHGFEVSREGQPPAGDGWLEMHARVAEWFLGPASTAPPAAK